MNHSHAAIRCTALLGLLCLCTPFAACQAEPPESHERDEWAAVMWGEQKIGYAHLTAQPEDEGEMAGLTRMAIEVTARLSDMGVPMDMDISIVQWIDPETGRPVRVEAVIPTGEEPTRKTIVFTEDKAQVTRQSYDGESTYEIDLPTDAPLVGDLVFLTLGPVEPHEAAVYYNLLTDRLQLAKTRLTQADDGGWTVRGNFSGGAYALELDPEWRLTRGTGVMGIAFDVQPEEQARDLGSDDYLPPAEFGLGVATARPLPDPRTVESLTVTITGLQLEGGVPEIDGRQSVEDLGDERYRVTVQTRGIEQVSGPSMGFPVPEDLHLFLEAGPFIDSQAPGVAKAAEEVVAGMDDAARAAEALNAWVDERMVFGGIMDTARTGTQILESSRGVCRDYAALYAAMARSVGIPSRLCTGLVYARDGFYLHTWAESWLGEENGWVPLDPTRSGRPVDATHITFLRGDVESVWRVMEIVGALEVEVEDVQTQR
jgi:hypothetical protein